jgi:hypothetical protein
MRRKIFMIPAAILGMVAFTFIGGEIVLNLWNWLAPMLFGLHTITFWQALGLLVLTRMLFGGFGFRGRRGGRHLRDKWENMTPEERDRFREGMRDRCGPFSRSTPTQTAPSSAPTPGTSTTL